MKDNISTLYGALKAKGYTDIGKDESEFRNWIGQEGNVRALYTALSDQGFDDIGNEQEFTNWIGVKQEPKGYTVNNIVTGGVGTQEEADRLFDENLRKRKQKQINVSELPTLEQQVQEGKNDGKLKFGKPGYTKDESDALYPMSPTSLNERLSDPRIFTEDMSIRAAQEADEEADIDKYYTSKPMNTAKDVYDNFRARFSNTKRGIELGDELARKTDEVQNKYLKEYLASDNYKKLVATYKGDELVKQANEQFNMKYGGAINDELLPYQKAYNDEVNIRYGSQMDKELKRINKDDAGTHARELMANVDSDLEDIEKRIDERKKNVRETTWRPGTPSTRDDKELAELRGKRTLLEGAKDLIEDSQNILNAVDAEKDGTFFGGLGRGFRDKVFDIDTWTMGLSDLVGGMRLKSVLQKAEKGEKLTSEEETLLDASLNNMAVNYYYRSDLGRGYKAGEMTGESLPFMLEFIVNPVSTSGNAIAGKLLNYGLKKYAKNKVAQGAARFVGDAIAAAGMTATTGLPGVLGEAVERTNRNYEYGFDEDGNLNVKKTGDESFGHALGMSATTRLLENQSEMIFNAFNGASKMLQGVEQYIPGGVNAFMNKIKNSRVGEVWRDIKNNPTMRELAERTQFHGIGEEYLEEVYNNFANVALGEMTYEEAIDLNNNIDTFLGLAPTSVAFGAIGAAGMATERYKNRRELERVFGRMTDEQKKKLEELQRMGKMSTNKDIAVFLSETIKDESLTPEQKRNEIEYAYDLAKQNAIDEITETDIQDKVADDNAIIDSVTDPSTGLYTEVDRLVLDEKGETVRQHGYVVGWLGQGESRTPIFLPEGVENSQENRIPLKPTEWDKESLRELQNGRVKEINEEMTREEAAVQAENEARWSPDVPDPQTGVSFFNGNEEVTIIGVDANTGGVFVAPTEEYLAAQGNERKMTDLANKAYQLGAVPVEQYKDAMTAQIEAAEKQQAQERERAANAEQAAVEELSKQAEVDMGEPVGEQVNGEVNDGVNTEVDNPMENVESSPMSPIETQGSSPMSPMSSPISEEKSTQSVIPTKEDGSIDFVAYGKEGSLRALGEKYGEKMPNKVAVTAKALADDLKKAQQKLDKAEEAYDNAPIGREEKADNARMKAREEYEAVKREADFWAEMDAEIKDAQKRREELLNPTVESSMTGEPASADEFIAQQLASGNIVLNNDDYMRETGYGSEEANAMNGGTQKLLSDNGMTIEAAGERLMEMDRENGTNYFDQTDANAGRDALLSVLGSVRSRKELNQYIAESRKAQAKKDAEGLRNAAERQVMDAHFSSLEDYVLQMEAAEMENPFDGIDIAVKDYIFAEAEEEYQQFLNSQENGQGTTEETIEGNSNVLPSEQSDDTGGIEGRQGQESERVGVRTPEEGEGTHVGQQRSEVKLEQKEGETTLQFAERVAEENRRRPLRERANEWAKALGVKVTFLESIDDVDARTRAQIEEAHAEGSGVPGWVASNGEVYFFMPDIRDLKDVDDTYIHEVVAHIGLPQLLGKERFGELCDKVWEMMPQSEKDNYYNYPGVDSINDSTEKGKVKRQRLAADEYIAHLAEKQDLTPEEKTIWDNIVKMFRELLDKALNGIIGKSKLTDADIAELIKASYANLKSGASENVGGEGTRFNAKKKRALETASVSKGKHQPTVVSSADGAKILNNLDNLQKEYEEKSSQSKTFLGDVAKAINARKQGSGSQYATFEAANGNVVTIRLADHNATVSNFDNRDENEGISIVVSAKDNNGITNDGDAHIVEYFYDSIDLRRANGKPLAEIVKSIKQSLYSGEYKDTTGLAERQEVNTTRFRAVKDKNELVAVHNISEENLRKVLKVGGLIMPSIAITKADMGHEGYGDISLLFDKETINPSDRRNKVYGGDAWTPRFPQMVPKINDKVSTNVRNKIRGLITDRTLSENYSLSAELHPDNIERTISDRGVEGYYNKEWMKLAYLLDNGKKVKIPMKMKDYGDMSETIIEMAKERGLKVFEIQQNGYDFYNNNKDFVESIKNIVDERKLSSLPEDKRDVARKLFGEKEMRFAYFDTLISAATKMEYDLEHGGLKEIIDRPALRESIEKKVKTNNADYNKWVDNLFDGIVEKYGIRNDRDWYTPSGNLRPWGQLYDDATPANILRHMLTENEQGGSGNFFNSNIMGASAETYESIEEIREKGKKRLRRLDEGEYDEWSNSVSERMSEICNDFLSEKQRNEFGASIDAKIDITNAVAKDKTAKGIYKTMKRDYPGFTMGHAKKIEEIVKEIQDFAIGYFEAKPRRIVPLNEVRKAIVPSNTSSDILEGLKDNGIDVATYRKGNEASRSRLINKESNGIRFRVSNLNQEVFVSNAQKAVEGIKQEKGTPQQWLAMIEKNSGLKAGEDKWLGLSDWLKGLDKKSVTKAEILDFINQNKIRIEEVKYSGSGMYDEWYEDDVYDAVSNAVAESHGVEFRDEFMKAFVFEYDDYAERIRSDINIEEAAAPLYSRYNDDVIEVDSYGELTRRESNKIREWADRIVSDSMAPKNQSDKPINSTRLSYTTEGLENKQEIALVVPTIEPWNESDEIHFGDAGEGRAVAWIRFGETTTPNVAFINAREAVNDYIAEMREKYNVKGGGIYDVMNEDEVKHLQELTSAEFDTRDKAERVLVIDEIQSKRHQEGREKGYKKDVEIELGKWTTTNKAGHKTLISEVPVAEVKIKGSDEVIAHIVHDNRGVSAYYVVTPNNTSTAYKNEEDALSIAERMVNKQEGKIPEAPFEKNWHELAMKRMLRYAAENGYDKVAWTTGAQQAERYGIGGVVSSISKGRKRGDNTLIQLEYNNGKRDSWVVDPEGRVVDGGVANGETLGDIIGKELAVKVMSLNEGEEISGEGLRVGGEGMKGFYDKMLPSFVNKYVKKWGTKVQDIELPNVEEAGRTMHSVEVTDAMKESVMEGQTMFRVKREDAQKQVDNFTSKYNSKPVAVVEAAMSDEELSEAFNGQFEVDDIRDFMNKSKSIGGFIRNLNKVVIFADKMKWKRMEESLFHENIHALINEGDYTKLLAQLYEYAKDDEAFSRWRKISENSEYKPYERAEEFFAYVVSNGMVANNLEDVLKHLDSERQSELNELLNKIGYDYDIRRRSNGQSVDGRTAEGLAEESAVSGNASEESGRRTEGKRRTSGGSYEKIEGLRPEGSGVQEVDERTGRETDESGTSEGVQGGSIEGAERDDARTKEQAERLGQLFERVANEGLRGVVGDAAYDLAMINIYHALPESERVEVSMNAVRNLGGNVAAAVDEYLDEKGNPSLWEKVVGVFRDMFRKAGFDIELNGNDVKYLLWRSKKPLDRNNLVEVAEDIDKKYRLKVGEYNGSPTDGGNTSGGGIRFKIKAELKEDIRDLKEEVKDLKGELKDLKKQVNALRSGSKEEWEKKQRAIISFIKGRLTKEAGSVLGKTRLDQLLTLVNKASTSTELYKPLQFIEQVINDASIEHAAAKMDKLIKIKLQGETNRGVAKGVVVDESTRRLFDSIRGTFKDLIATSIDSELRSVRGEILRFGKERNALPEDDLQGRAILQARQDALKERKKELEKEQEELQRQNVNETKESLERRHDDLVEAMDAHINGEGVWTNEMQDEYDSIPLRLKLAEIRESQSQLDVILTDSIMTRRNAYKTTGKDRKKLLAEADVLESNYTIAQEELIRLMNEVSGELSAIINEGKSRLATRRQALAERRRHIVGMGISAVKDKKVKELNAILTRKEKFEKWLDNSWLKSFSNFMTTPLNSFNFMLKYIDRNHTIGEGELYKQFMKSEEGALEANNRLYDGLKAYNTAIEEKAREIFGKDIEKIIKDSGKEFVDKIHKQYMYDSSDHKEGDMYPISISKGQAFYVWLTWRQEDGRAKLIADGWNDQSIEEIESLIGEDYMKFGEWITDDFFPNLREEKYNKTHIEMFGTSMAKREHYFPFKISGLDIQEKGELGERYEGMPSTVTGNIIKRTINKSRINTEQNAFDLLYKYGNDMETWNAMVKLRQDLNFLRASKAFKNYLEANSKGLFDKFMKSAEVAVKAYNNSGESNAINDFFVKINRMWAGSNIGFRLNTAMKQILSYPAFMAYSGNLKYQSYLIKNASKELWWDYSYRWALENLPAFRQRVETGDLGMTGMTDPQFDFAKHIKKFTDAGMIPNKLVDAFTCAIGAKSVYEFEYDKAIENGLTEEEAKNVAQYNAEVAFNETQQSSREEFVSPIQMSRNVLIKSMMNYQNSNIGYQRLGNEGLLEIMRAKHVYEQDIKNGMDKKEAQAKLRNSIARGSRKMMVAFIILPGLWYLGGRGIVGITSPVISSLFGGGGDDEPYLDEEAKTELLLSMGLGTVAGTTLGQPIASIAQGREYNPMAWMNEMQKDIKDAVNNGWNLNVTKNIALRLSKFGGVNVETWENIYLGVEHAIRTGNPDLVDFMMLINLPASQRKAMAEELYSDMPFMEYAEKVARAQKLYDDYRKYLPYAKTDKNGSKANAIKKQYVIENLSDGKQEDYEKEKEYKKLKREYGQAENKDEWLEDHPEYKELEKEHKDQSVTKEVDREVKKLK